MVSWLQNIGSLIGNLILSVDAGRAGLIFLVFVGVLPAVAASLIWPSVLGPVGVTASTFLLYWLFLPRQSDLAQIDTRLSVLWLELPLYLLVLAWAGLVIAVGNHNQVFRSVGPVFVLVVTCISPVYRWKRVNRSRRIPFESVYTVIAGLAGCHQGLIFLEEVYTWFA